MSLMGTLGKVAMGVIVAKGVGKMMGGSSGSSGGGLGGLLGSLTGGNNSNSGNTGGGLGGLLGGLAGNSGSGGGLGGILDSLGGSNNSQSGGGLGDLLNNALNGNDPEATSEQDNQAEVMLRAMISAAKSDGVLDDEEKRKITEHLGDATPEEIAFVRQELESPLDTQGLIQSVPRGMEEQVYFMALLAIDLDSNHEAKFLDELAKGLNISNQTCNQIHEKLGAPALYS
ncbi:hypothetical protein GCM10009133_27440 [Cocleimonas flava]|uniref:Uncharacterized membrane protein YebE (DUF533 family) n=1 Tax=Cocleimonas flava TaxID=634765 RepID=A0A4R1EU25_9GAMM|nr:DUF533 domain-containing protein [Cocleimonas flava]TCJ83279.1 uncharacterized membrane protein YebE (DUF533 family) [Cocleimonas flava]